MTKEEKVYRVLDQLGIEYSVKQHRRYIRWKSGAVLE